MRGDMQQQPGLLALFLTIAGDVQKAIADLHGFAGDAAEADKEVTGEPTPASAIDTLVSACVVVFVGFSGFAHVSFVEDAFPITCLPVAWLLWALRHILKKTKEKVNAGDQVETAFLGVGDAARAQIGVRPLYDFIVDVRWRRTILYRGPEKEKR